MRITIFAAGSRGDIQPCTVLGRGLQKAGFEVQVAAPENFGHFVNEFGLSFHPLRGDVQKIMASETGQDFMESGGNPISAIKAMRKMIHPIAQQMAEDLLHACRSTDALISLAVFAPFAHTASEILDIPLLLVEPTPMLATGDFPAAGWPVQRDLGRLHNRFSGYAMLQMIWQWYGPVVNRLRERHGMRRYTGSVLSRILSTVPLLGAYSQKVIPRPSDWPAKVHITGYWFSTTPEGWEPPSHLRSFLDADEPPVYFGFGSMGGRNPKRLGAIVLEALAKSKKRGVLMTGWGGLRAQVVPENVLILDNAPHSWLFPRMSAVVHHGGAGTTAEVLRAGVPSVIVPFILDQTFWGRRIKKQGVGPEPIPLKKLDSNRLAEAIDIVVTDPGIRQRAKVLGEQIRAEDGVSKAVEIIGNYLR